VTTQLQLIIIIIIIIIMFRLARVIIGHYVNHVQIYQLAVYFLGIPKCITKIRASDLDMPAYGSNDLMVTLASRNMSSL